VPQIKHDNKYTYFFEGNLFSVLNVDVIIALGKLKSMVLQQNSLNVIKD
jgi:hypothetical protein